MRQISKHAKAGLFVFTLLIAVVAGAYLNSRRAANHFMRPFIEYFILESNNYVPLPRSFPKDSSRPFAYEFQFCNPYIFDACCEIYISPLGKIISTNPTDLRERLPKALSSMQKVSKGRMRINL